MPKIDDLTQRMQNWWVNKVQSLLPDDTLVFKPSETTKLILNGSEVVWVLKGQMFHAGLTFPTSGDRELHLKSKA